MTHYTWQDRKPASSYPFTRLLIVGILSLAGWASCGAQASRAAEGSDQKTDGTWTVVSSPVAATYNLLSVATVSGSDAWAVGNKGYGSNGVSWGPVILRWDGHAWSELPLFEPSDHFNLESVTAISANDVWTVGGGDWWGDSFTAIYHWDGTAWHEIAGGPNYLRSVAAISPSDVWAVGVYEDWVSPISTTWGAATTHWNGTMWEGNATIGWFGLRSLAVVSPNNVWAVGGGGIILHFDGNAWTRISSPTTQGLNSVAMISADNGWAVGENGAILHWDGSAWRSTTSPVSQGLNSIAMPSSADGWIVGKNGTILHWDGAGWSQAPSPVSQTLKSVTMLSADEGWAVGEKGVILHYPDEPTPPGSHIFLPIVIRY